jgi:hypothetical protein
MNWLMAKYAFTVAIGNALCWARLHRWWEWRSSDGSTVHRECRHCRQHHIRPHDKTTSMENTP